MVISKISRNGQVLCELRNIGPDSLSEMDVTIKWLQDGHIQSRRLEHFFSPQQDERTASASHVQLLGPADSYIVVGLPQSSDDGIVDVEVEGLGVKSQRIYSARTQLDVPLKRGE